MTGEYNTLQYKMDFMELIQYPLFILNIFFIYLSGIF